MRTARHSRARPSRAAATLFVLLCALHAPAWPHSVTPEDQKLIDEANCDEIVKQYRIHSDEEKAVMEEIRRTSNSTVATNVIGAATLATFGLGFFTWDNNVGNEENLADLRAYKNAIGAAGRKKNCALP
jgi:hypothetical protein